MSVTEQEPVIEQPIDSQKSVDSAPIEVAPLTSTKIKETAPEVPANENKEELNYLSSELFSEIRQVSFEDFLDNDVIEEVSDEDQER